MLNCIAIDSISVDVVANTSRYTNSLAPKVISEERWSVVVLAMILLERQLDSRTDMLFKYFGFQEKGGH